MRIIVLVTVVLLSACSVLPPLPEWQGPEGRDHADLGLIVDLRNNAVLTPAQLAAVRYQGAPVSQNANGYLTEYWGTLFWIE